MKFDEENNLHFIDVFVKTEDNLVQNATFYFTPEGKAKCFEPYSEYIDFTGDGDLKRHYYNRTNIIEDLKEVEPMYYKDIAELISNKNLNVIYDKAVDDAYNQSCNLKWSDVKDFYDYEVEIEDCNLSDNRNTTRKSSDLEL